MSSCVGRSLFLICAGTAAALSPGLAHKANSALSADVVESHGDVVDVMSPGRAMMRKESPRAAEVLMEKSTFEVEAIEVPFHGSMQRHKVHRKAQESEEAEPAAQNGMINKASERLSLEHRKHLKKHRKRAKKMQDLIDERDRSFNATTNETLVKENTSDVNATAPIVEPADQGNTTVKGLPSTTVKGLLRLEVTDREACISDSDGSEKAIAMAVAPDSVPTENVKIQLEPFAGGVSSSFLEIFYKKTGGTGGSLDANFTITTDKEADGSTRLLADAESTATSIAKEISENAHLTQMAEKLQTAFKTSGINVNVTVKSLEAWAGSADPSEPVDAAKDHLDESEDSAEDEDENLVSGELVIEVHNVSEFLDNGRAQEDVVNTIAEYAGANRDDIDEKWDPNVHKSKHGRQFAIVRFDITVPRLESPDDVARDIRAANGVNKSKMKASLATALAYNGFANDVNITRFLSAGDMADAVTGEGADVTHGSSIALTTSAPTPAPVVAGGTTAAPAVAGDTTAAPAAPDDQLDQIIEDPDETGEGGTTKDPLETATMTTSFVPLDEIDGTLTMQVADIVAFTKSSEIQNAFCSKLAFKMLAYPEDVLCTFKVTDNVTSALLETSRRNISDQADQAEVTNLAQFSGPRAGGITVDFIMNVPDAGINDTLTSLKTMDMTLFVESVTEDIKERGLQAPAMEIAALFVDGLKTNIAEPPQPLRLAFGDNVTKWSPEEVAHGGPPTQPPPWIVADEVAENATAAATVAAAAAASSSADASADATTNATVQTDPAIENTGGTPAPTPQAVISPAKTDVDYKNDATETSSGASGTTSGAAGTTSGTTAGATGTTSGTAATGTTSGTAPTPAPVTTTTVNMAAGGPSAGLGGAPTPAPAAATAATATTGDESPQAGAKRCASMGLMVQILIGTLFSMGATSAAM